MALVNSLREMARQALTHSPTESSPRYAMTMSLTVRSGGRVVRRGLSASYMVLRGRCQVRCCAVSA